MEGRKRKQYDSNFTFYLTHPVTVTCMTQLVSGGNTEDVKYKSRTTPVFMLL